MNQGLFLGIEVMVTACCNIGRIIGVHPLQLSLGDGINGEQVGDEHPD